MALDQLHVIEAELAPEAYREETICEVIVVGSVYYACEERAEVIRTDSGQR